MEYLDFLNSITKDKAYHVRARYPGRSLRHRLKMYEIENTTMWNNYGLLFLTLTEQQREKSVAWINGHEQVLRMS